MLAFSRTNAIQTGMTLFYAILIAIFAVVIIASVIYVNRLKAKERALGITRPELDREGGIEVATRQEEGRGVSKP